MKRWLKTKRAKTAAASGLGVIAMAVTYLISPWEGMRTTAYYDAVGVLTICEGDTGPHVKPGQTVSREECRARTIKRVSEEFYPALVKCVPGFEEAPVTVQAAALSLAYNVGTRKACNASAMRYFKPGQYEEACRRMTFYNRAGDRVLDGLTYRREYGDRMRLGEYELCVAGL